MTLTRRRALVDLELALRLLTPDGCVGLDGYKVDMAAHRRAVVRIENAIKWINNGGRK